MLLHQVITALGDITDANEGRSFSFWSKADSPKAAAKHIKERLNEQEIILANMAYFVQSAGAAEQIDGDTPAAAIVAYARRDNLFTTSSGEYTDFVNLDHTDAAGQALLTDAQKQQLRTAKDYMSLNSVELNDQLYILGQLDYYTGLVDCPDDTFPVAPENSPLRTELLALREAMLLERGVAEAYYTTASRRIFQKFAEDILKVKFQNDFLAKVATVYDDESKQHYTLHQMIDSYFQSWQVVTHELTIGHVHEIFSVIALYFKCYTAFANPTVVTEKTAVYPAIRDALCTMRDELLDDMAEQAHVLGMSDVLDELMEEYERSLYASLGSHLHSLTSRFGRPDDLYTSTEAAVLLINYYNECPWANSFADAVDNVVRLYAVCLQIQTQEDSSKYESDLRHVTTDLEGDSQEGLSDKDQRQRQAVHIAKEMQAKIDTLHSPALEEAINGVKQRFALQNIIAGLQQRVAKLSAKANDPLTDALSAVMIELDQLPAGVTSINENDGLQQSLKTILTIIIAYSEKTTVSPGLRQACDEVRKQLQDKLTTQELKAIYLEAQYDAYATQLVTGLTDDFTVSGLSQNDLAVELLKNLNNILDTDDVLLAEGYIDYDRYYADKMSHMVSVINEQYCQVTGVDKIYTDPTDKLRLQQSRSSIYVHIIEKQMQSMKDCLPLKAYAGWFICHLQANLQRYVDSTKSTFKAAYADMLITRLAGYYDELQESSSELTESCINSMVLFLRHHKSSICRLYKLTNSMRHPLLDVLGDAIDEITPHLDAYTQDTLKRMQRDNRYHLHENHKVTLEELEFDAPNLSQLDPAPWYQSLMGADNNIAVLSSCKELSALEIAGTWLDEEIIQYKLAGLESGSTSSSPASSST